MLGSRYIVKKISGKEGREFIRKYHYSRTCHNGPMCWGLIDTQTEQLVGVVAFATPCSENVRASVFGHEYKDRVTELHRLFTFDDLPKNATSYLVGRGIRGLCKYRKNIRGIITFADATEGHSGGIYRATNFMFCGMTSSAIFFRDEQGRLRHPRQGGINITRKMAKDMNWTPERRDSKFRYVLIVGPKRDRNRFKKLLKLDVLEIGDFL